MCIRNKNKKENKKTLSRTGGYTKFRQRTKLGGSPCGLVDALQLAAFADYYDGARLMDIRWYMETPIKWAA